MESQVVVEFLDALQAKDLFKRDEGGWAYRGMFVSLCGDVHMAAAMDRPDLAELNKNLFNAVTDIWQLFTLCERLQWTREQAASSDYVTGRWMDFAGADISHWHVDFRSLLDHLAKVIHGLAVKSKQVPDSFTKLYDRAQLAGDADDFALKLGMEWLTLLRSADWYPTLLWVRDGLVHKAARTIIFGKPSDGILFQVYRHGEWRGGIHLGPLMYNDNVVYFERYAAYMIARLLLFLEDLAGVAYDRTGLIPTFTSTNYSPGYGTFLDWATNVRKGLLPPET